MLRPYRSGRVTQQAVGHFVNGAIAAHGDDMTRPGTHGARRELDAVSRTSGALRLHAPALAPELAHDRVEGPRRRTAPRGGIEDDVGMDQRRIISSEARSGSGIGPRGGQVCGNGAPSTTTG